MTRCTKVRYRTELDAKIALSNTRRKADRTSREVRQERRCYRCPHCAGWHLTSKGKRA